MNDPLSFAYDPATDILTIEGIKYAGGLFRNIAYCEEGKWFRVVARKDGIVSLQEKFEPYDRLVPSAQEVGR